MDRFCTIGRSRPFVLVHSYQMKDPAVPYSGKSSFPFTDDQRSRSIVPSKVNRAILAFFVIIIIIFILVQRKAAIGSPIYPYFQCIRRFLQGILLKWPKRQYGAALYKQWHPVYRSRIVHGAAAGIGLPVQKSIQLLPSGRYTGLVPDESVTGATSMDLPNIYSSLTSYTFLSV